MLGFRKVRQAGSCLATAPCRCAGPHW